MKLAHVALVALVALTGLARADDADHSEAQRLFEEGRTLLDSGKTDEACDKFELSLAKDPRAVGTLLNLGLCNERRGKPATALALFQEAYDRASEANMIPHRDAAQQHIALLMPQIPTLVVHVTSPVAGESVFIDDHIVKTAELHLDPGTHHVVASATGRLPFDTTVKLAVGDRRDLKIPTLQLPRTVVEHGSSRPLIGKIAMLSGAGLLGVTGGMALYAYRTYHRAFDDGNCQVLASSHLCNERGQTDTTRARSVATGATVVGAVGILAVGGGLALWLTAPKDDRPQIVPTASADGAGVSVVGRF